MIPLHNIVQVLAGSYANTARYVMTRGVPWFLMALRKKRLAAVTSRCSLSRKSTVRPCLSTARYRYVHRPFIYRSRHSATTRLPVERIGSSAFQNLAHSVAPSAESWCVLTRFRARPSFWTKSRELSLNLRYQRTHGTMISRHATP